MIKKYILAIVIFSIFVVSTIGLKVGNQIIPIQVKEVFNNETSAGIHLREIKQEGNGYRLSIFYPETKFKKLNIQIQERIKKEKKDFLEKVKEVENILEGKTCTFDITFNQYEYQDYLSFAFEITVYLCGAHPNNYYFTVNYDTKNNEMITVETMLKKDSAFLDKLAKESYDILKEEKQVKEYSNEDYLKEGLKAIQSNYENFIFDKDKLIVFINRYQIAPYVAGNFEVRIPYGKIM